MVDLQFKNYHITSSKYGYNVCKMSMEDGQPLFNQTKSGLQIREQPVGYYHDLRQALKGIVRNIVRTGDDRIESIYEFKEAVKQAKNELDKFINDNIPEE